MRKQIFAIVLCMAVGLFAAPSQAQVNRLNEPGSLLAYPLIDNLHGTTIVNIANVCNNDIVLECYMITHGIDGNIDEKTPFLITLTGKEKFHWISNQPYDQGDNEIQGFDDRKGYMVCFMINNRWTRLEVGGNCLLGSATLLPPNFLGTPPPDQDCGGRRQPPCPEPPSTGDARNSAFKYNAIPHQGLAVVGDRVLNLNGAEYTAATSQIMFEGLAALPGAIGGTLAVASPGIDFISETQPEFGIELLCWNEVETLFSRELTFKDFEQYDLSGDCDDFEPFDGLCLGIEQIFTLGFHCQTVTTHPLWAVFHQKLEPSFGWAGNVWQYAGAAVTSQIVLEPQSYMNITFSSRDGIAVADADGMTFYLDYYTYIDRSLVYAEDYWGEYALYLPGHQSAINVDLIYKGPAAQTTVQIVTETYAMNLDGSNGDLLNGPNTTERTLLKDVFNSFDAGFTMPLVPKGLYRFVARIYEGDTLMMRSEAIFCPPPTLVP